MMNTTDTKSRDIVVAVDAMLLTLSLLEEINGLKSEIRAKSIQLQRELNDSYLKYAANTAPKGCVPANTKKVETLRNDIEKNKQLIDSAEKAILSVEDSQMRAILTLRYIEGLGWSDVAKAIYKRASADSVRKRVARYFGKK